MNENIKDDGEKLDNKEKKDLPKIKQSNKHFWKIQSFKDLLLKNLQKKVKLNKKKLK